MAGTGRVALVTGAGSGIGRAASIALQAAGYSVVLAGRRRAELEQTSVKPDSRGGKFLVVPTDVTKPESVAALFANTQQTFGRLDVLFNNAGAAMLGTPVEDVQFDQWLNIVNVNLNGVFLCAQHAIRIMKAQTPMGGRIINNGSISAYVPRPNSAAYTATKHAVLGLTKVLSLEGRQHNIACSQIDIGNAASALTEKMSGGSLQANGSTIVEPVMDVKHVADAVVWMANLPLDANAQYLTLMASNMPFIGRG